ncbi:hypothetical protein CCR75_003460 [Bremia lactucae]|uniref:Uncharacterized protein n=1 Tax=Bremia lactucae TaxID=4779 RepID=A0A976IDK6_BRELC|nr:hypothetical protein CCR75_003460 [Bremia lactucae]
MASSPATPDDVASVLPRCDSATWSFVQMNMTLLPIARPLPVSVNRKSHEGAALVGLKPSTPTQKLHHHRLRQLSTTISPRRHECACNGLRSMTTPPGTTRRLPPASMQANCGAKRKYSETWNVPIIDTALPSNDKGYLSDHTRHMLVDSSPVHRRASIAAGCAGQGLYKGKRILELQDEERRLHPDERITAASPSKRSKL